MSGGWTANRDPGRALGSARADRTAGDVLRRQHLPFENGKVAEIWNPPFGRSRTLESSWASQSTRAPGQARRGLRPRPAPPRCLSPAGRALERPLVRGAVVQRLAVRDDHVLERELEQRAQRRKRPLLVPRRRPDAQLAAGRGQRVGEDERALLRQPERRLVAAAAVVERDEAARKLAPRLDRLELGLRDVVREEELGPNARALVARAKRSTSRTWSGLSTTTRSAGARPAAPRSRRRPRAGASGSSTATSPPDSTHVEATSGSQSASGCPVGMLDAPEPEPGRDVAHLVRHGASRSSAQAPSGPRL